MGLSANSYTHGKSLGTGIIPNLLPTLTGTSASAEAENRPSADAHHQHTIGRNREQPPVTGTRHGHNPLAPQTRCFSPRAAAPNRYTWHTTSQHGR